MNGLKDFVARDLSIVKAAASLKRTLVGVRNQARKLGTPHARLSQSQQKSKRFYQCAHRNEFNRNVLNPVDERRRGWPSIHAADNHMRCPTCGGWIDFSGCVVDHAGPLPHPAIDQTQWLRPESHIVKG